MGDFKGSAYGITKREHDELTAGRTRALTDPHPGLRNTQQKAAPDITHSLLERIMQKDDAE